MKMYKQHDKINNIIIHIKNYPYKSKCQHRVNHHLHLIHRLILLKDIVTEILKMNIKS